MIELLDNRINLYIILLIMILALLDIILKRDLKSQIVSLGVLGTFIGIFIGLQGFNPEDMKNSINNILLGLKTAFFTSIVGMGTALILSIIQKLSYKKDDSSSMEESLLVEISEKLNIDKIIDELQRLRVVERDTQDETIKIYNAISELKENANRENRELIDILEINFGKMNSSLEIAIDRLSRGATEEIIKALEQVIQEFNQELQSSFGDNFVKLNEAVINLVEWQDNYKIHIEEIEKHLDISSYAIQKSEESLNNISSKNEDILKVYQELQHIIEIYDKQIQNLTEHLETYSNLSSNAENMFLTISSNISKTKDDFTNLTEHIKYENGKQIDYNLKMAKSIQDNFNQNQQELELINRHFQNLGVEIPKALNVSLHELNRGLSSLTLQFQKDYRDIMIRYKDGLN